MSSVSSPEEVCNLALRSIGYPNPVGDIYEGSPQAQVALQFYAQTRDALLRSQDWPFARRDAALALAGQSAPAPWLYEYTWPSDCLRLQYVAPSLTAGPVLTVQPQRFTLFNDARLSPPAKTILANISPAIAIYIGQVVEIPQWEPKFVDALVSALARRFSIALAASVDLMKTEGVIAEGEAMQAVQASELQPPLPTIPQATQQPQQR